MLDFDYAQLLKATNDFSPSRVVGKGSHGLVYKGVLDQNNIVAVKKSTLGFDHVSNDNSKKLENEISVLSSLPENPCVVKFLGTSRGSPDHVQKMSKLLVMEFLPNGSLHDLLHVPAAFTPPSWPKRVEIAIQLARALQFLHENKPNLVIHRDVKSANVLFDSSWNAKLADFGLAVLIDSPGYQPSQPAGTIGYLDPCYTTPSKLSTKNDVFSYGVVLLEIISGRRAIDVNKAPALIVEWAVPLIKKQRIPLSEICDARIALPAFMEGTIRHLLKVAAHCVSSTEEHRPSIGEIVMGMDNYSLIQRFKVMPSWSGLIKSVMLNIRRRRKLANQWRTNKYATQKRDVHSDIAKGKLLLREIYIS